LGFNKIEREDETEQISEPEPINLGQSPSFYEQEDDDLELSSVATGEHHTNKEDRGNSWWKTKEVIAEYEKKLLGD